MANFNYFCRNVHVIYFTEFSYDPEHEKAKAQVKKLQKYRMPILILKSDNDIDVFRTL